MKKRVADIIMEILVERGITDLFCVVGGGSMHLNNAMALNTKINKYFNHHEQACAMAAEGYARLGGRIAAVCATSGPGGTNLLTGVMGSWVDSIPMLVLTGQVRNSISVEEANVPLRYRGIQEFDIIGSVRNMTKYAIKIKDPLSIKRELNKAIDIAMLGRRGPTWLDIPLDIQAAVVEESELYPLEQIELPSTSTIRELETMLEKLKNAKRPVILAGRGIVSSGNLEAYRDFVKKLNIPVVSASISADNMYMDYERYYGLSGSIGPRTGNFIIQNADVIVSIACSLGYSMTGFAQNHFAPNAYIIAVDIDENEMKKPGVRVDQLIQSDLSSFFEMAQSLQMDIPVDSFWIEYCNKLKNRFSPFEPGINLPEEDRVCSYYFWSEFEKYEPSDSICVLGNNTANTAKLQIGTKKEKQRVLTNKNCGSMGYDLPASIGAAAAASGKNIYCITGDGSIMMNLQELQTIQHYKLPIKIIVFSNDGYNAIRQTSKNFFKGKNIGCTPETGVSFPDFKKIADTFGFSYRCCNRNKDVADSLQWVFKQNSPILLEIKQRLDDPVNPKLMSRILPDGTFATPALHDMEPFLDEEEIKNYMLW